MRGIPLGLISWYAMKTFAARAPAASVVHRWGRLYGVTAFLFGTFIGVSSYKEKCFQKIMQLDNSRLKEQVLIAKGQKEGCSAAPSDQPSVGSGRPPVDTKDRVRYRPRPGMRPKQDEPLPPPPPPSEESVDQPSAFQESSQTSFGWNADQPATGSGTRGRTFDEIRAENRRRQFQPKPDAHPEENDPSSSGQDHWRRDQTQLVGSDSNQNKRVRRNKYGDIIIDD